MSKNDAPLQTPCACIGGSTYGTSDPTIRLCDLCGGMVPTDPDTGEHASSRTPAQTSRKPVPFPPRKPSPPLEPSHVYPAPIRPVGIKLGGLK